MTTDDEDEKVKRRVEHLRALAKEERAKGVTYTADAFEHRARDIERRHSKRKAKRK